MTRFFIFGNFWLFVALVLVIGRTTARTQPTLYSFFDIGGWYYPTTYNLWIGVCMAAAIACLVLTVITWRKSISSTGK